LGNANAQLHCINYTAQDGLPANNVLCAAEDQQGFMWFGTSYGLCRYDGSRFLNFSNVGNGSTPGGIYITQVAIDSGNDIWIGTEKNGIYHLNRKENFWTNYSMNSESTFRLVNNKITCLKSFQDGNIWFSCDNGGLGKIDRINQKMESYSLNHLPRKNTWPNRVLDIQPEAGDQTKLNLIGQGYVFQFDTRTKKFITLSKDVKGLSNLNTSLSLQSIAAVPKDSFWLGTWHSGIVTLERGGTKFNRLKLPSAISDWTERADVFPKADKEIWAVFRSYGILKYDIETNKIYHFQAEAFNRNGLLGGQYNGVFHSKSGDTWILGTLGISLIIQEYQAFEYFETDYPKNNYFLDIATIPSTDNYIAAFAGEDGPVKIYDKDFKVLKRLYFKNATFQTVYQILKYKNQIFCVSDKLFEYKTKTQSLEKFNLKAFKQKSRINRAMITNDDILWILFDNRSILKYNLLSDQYILKDLERHKNLGLYMVNYEGMEKVGNELWIAAQTEMVIVDIETLSISYFTMKDDRIAKCSDKENEKNVGNISNILAIDKACAWVSNHGNGIYKICKDEKSLAVKEIRNKDRMDQLLSPTDIIKDNESGYWLATRNGLMKSDEEMKSFKVFKEREGLRNSNLSQGLTRLEDFLFMGMPKGFARVNTKLLESKRPGLKCEIEEIMLNDERIDTLKKTAFPHTSNDFYARVSCANFYESKELIYAHRLLNFAENWVMSNANENQFRYENLPPGSYTFEVKSKSPSLEWSATESQDFKIKSPFWATTWFRLLSILCLGFIIFRVYKSRMNKAVKEEQIKTEFAELKSQALRAQMNPHFIFNSLNSIKSLVLLDRKQEGIKYLTKFSKMVREILQISEQALIPLAKELEILHIYLEMEQLRFHEKFHYEINVDPNVNVYKQKIPPMLIQPYVENSIWHGLLHKEGDAHLKICIAKENSTLVITIEDDGIGREASQLLKNKKSLFHKDSKGLKINKGRIELLDNKASIEIKDLYDEDNAIGTKVIIKIPDHE